MTVTEATLYMNNLSFTKVESKEQNEEEKKLDETVKKLLSLSEKVEKLEKDVATKVLEVLKKVSEEMNSELLKLGESGKEVNTGSSTNISIMEFSAQTLEIELNINTKEGVENKKVELRLEESFLRKANINFSKEMSPKEKLLDPIVIDFEGSGDLLSDKKFNFDLDSDGKKDQISMLNKGSGYLALDKNEDGKINNGNELFGTKSGNGYKDLEEYDENRDGQLDINDSIYSKLRIWKKDDSGEDKLIGLGEAGVGVIYLNPQELRNNIYDSRGNISGIAQKSAGVQFLDGKSGSSYHLDLVAV